jgi:uncharacterized protein with GYD domain
MKFVVLSNLTDEGAKTLKSNPQRVKEVNSELEKMGVKVLSQFVTLGGYDFVNIVDAPDTATVGKAMVELASRGSVRTTTLPAVELDEFLSTL